MFGQDQQLVTKSRQECNTFFKVYYVSLFQYLWLKHYMLMHMHITIFILAFNWHLQTNKLRNEQTNIFHTLHCITLPISLTQHYMLILITIFILAFNWHLQTNKQTFFIVYSASLFQYLWLKHYMLILITIFILVFNCHLQTNKQTFS